MATIHCLKLLTCRLTAIVWTPFAVCRTLPTIHQRENTLVSRGVFLGYARKCLDGNVQTIIRCLSKHTMSRLWSIHSANGTVLFCFPHHNVLRTRDVRRQCQHSRYVYVLRTYIPLLNVATSDRSSVIRGCLDDSNALVEAKTLQAGDHRINMKMVECPGLTPRSPTSDLPRSVPKPKSLVARPASQCTMPDICVCGAGCMEPVYAASLRC